MVEKIYVDEIQITGCQAFEDVTYNLVRDKLNVIVAPNNVGKSILMKLLKIFGCPTYYDSDTEFLIRTGCTSASIFFKASDGVICGCTITRKTVEYYYMEEEDGEVLKTNHPTEEMLRHAGLIANEEEEFIANIVDDSSSLMLVDPRSTASVDCVRMLFFDEQMEHVKAVYPEKLTKYNNELNKVNTLLAATVREISSIQYVDEEALRARIAGLKQLRSLANISVTACKQFEIVAQNIPSIRDFRELEQMGNVGYCIHRIGLELSKCYYETLADWLEPACSLATALQVIAVESSKLYYERFIFGRAEQLLRVADIHKLLVKQLSSVWVPSISVDNTEKMVECGSNLQSIAQLLPVIPVEEKDFNRMEQLVAIGERLAQASTSLAQLANTTQKAKEVAQELKVIRQYLAENAKILKCPVHGEVAYNGKTCIPTGN